jgi:hypothetical protein
MYTFVMHTLMRARPLEGARAHLDAMDVLNLRRPAPGSLVHHSDRGVQYPTNGGAWMEPVIMMRR